MNRNLLVKLESSSGKFQLTWKWFFQVLSVVRRSMLVGPSHALKEERERQRKKKKFALVNIYLVWTFRSVAVLVVDMDHYCCVLIISQSMSLWSLHLFKDVLVCHSRFLTIYTTYVCLSPLQIPCVLTKLPSSLGPIRAVYSSPRGLFCPVPSVGRTPCPFHSFHSYLVSSCYVPPLKHHFHISRLLASKPSQLCQCSAYFTLPARNILPSSVHLGQESLSPGPRTGTGL